MLAVQGPRARERCWTALPELRGERNIGRVRLFIRWRHLHCTHKYWPPVKRVDQVFGDTHFFCGCPAPQAWARDAP